MHGVNTEQSLQSGQAVFADFPQEPRAPRAPRPGAPPGKGFVAYDRAAFETPAVLALSAGARLLLHILCSGSVSSVVPGVAVATRQRLGELMGCSESTVQRRMRELREAGLVQSDENTAAIRILGVNPRVSRVTPILVMAWASMLARLRQTPFVRELVQHARRLAAAASAALAKAFDTQLVNRLMVHARCIKRGLQRKTSTSTRCTTGSTVSRRLEAPKGQLRFAWTWKGLKEAVSGAVQHFKGQLAGSPGSAASQPDRAVSRDSDGTGGKTMAKAYPTEAQSRRQLDDTYRLLEERRRPAPADELAHRREQARKLAELFGSGSSAARGKPKLV